VCIYIAPVKQKSTGTGMVTVKPEILAVRAIKLFWCP